MDSIWHAWRPCTGLTPNPHIQRYSRHHQQHETAGYDSAQRRSNQNQALPSGQLCRETSTTGEWTSLCSAALCWPQNPVYNKINSVNTCKYIAYACLVLVCTLSVHVHTLYIGLYNLKPHWLCIYIACTLETHVHTLYVHGVYMFYDLHTVSKHHIYNASCQEYSILYIVCTCLWIFKCVSDWQ